MHVSYPTTDIDAVPNIIAVSLTDYQSEASLLPPEFAPESFLALILGGYQTCVSKGHQLCQNISRAI